MKIRMREEGQAKFIKRKYTERELQKKKKKNMNRCKTKTKGEKRKKKGLKKEIKERKK